MVEGLRHFSQQLRPSILDDLGLVPAVKSLCADLSKETGIVVEAEIKGSPMTMKPDIELMLFRIVQEALTKVGKHSGTTSSQVGLVFGEGRVRLTAYDNGHGFYVPSEFNDLTGQGKLGPVGMKERLQLPGGTMVISSTSGNGTELQIEIPLDQGILLTERPPAFESAPNQPSKKPTHR